MSSSQRPESSLDPVAGDSGDDASRWYSTSIIASLAGVTASAIRNWQRLGLLPADSMENGAARFGFRQLSTARQIARLVEQGIRATTLARHFRRLQQHSPGSTLDDYSISQSGDQVLFRRNGETIDQSGQRHLDFDIAEGQEDDLYPLPVVSFPETGTSRQEIPDRETLLAIAALHEDAGEIREAIEALRLALLAGGPDAQTCFLLGELLYLSGEPGAARERYAMALELEPQLLEVRNSLGVLFFETGETEMAIATLQGALGQREDYPDTHYHLAMALEVAGRTEEAMAHWRRFLELAPASPWSDTARHRLGTENQIWFSPEEFPGR